jgi:putative ABC transport system ATP-binding protein
MVQAPFGVGLDVAMPAALGVACALINLSPVLSFLALFRFGHGDPSNGLQGNATPAFPQQVCYATSSCKFRLTLFIVLSIRNLSKTYSSAGQPIHVLRGVDLDVRPGERVALTGESGSGKSTLLHLIAGLDAADGGEIRLEGTEITALSDSGRAALRRDRLGLVFQQYNLIPSLVVEDNLAFQARIAGRHDAAWHKELIERLGLGDLLKRYPEQLSGGQQQRVAIGRALAIKPSLVLADEPTGNLDETTAEDVLALARDLVARTGCGLLMVTHSLHLAATLDRRVTLHAGVVT